MAKAGTIIARGLLFLAAFCSAAVSSGAETPGRQHIPTPDAQQQSRGLLDDVFQDQLREATTPALKSDLAKTLLQTGLDTKDQPAQSYVLFKSAGDLATRGDDFTTADAADEALCAAFVVNPLSLKIERYEALARTSSKAAEFDRWAVALGDWLDRQPPTDSLEQLERAADLAVLLARKSGDDALVARSLKRMSDLRKTAQAYQAMREPMSALAQNPADPAANLAVGRFDCFVAGDWRAGLPLLARGSNAQWKALAEQEIGGTVGAVAVGDCWWDAADAQPPSVRQQIRLHAATWYRQALPALTGFTRLRIEKRINETEPLSAAEQPENPPDAYPPVKGKILLIMDGEEAKVTEAACQKYGLPFEVEKSFDDSRQDYHGIQTILCGSNKMDYWEKDPHKDPAAFQYLNQFMRNGGHLVVFGRFNGAGMDHLKPYGITTSYYHGDHFAPVPGISELLFAGNENLVPTDTLLHTVGNFKCDKPHVVLIARVKKSGDPDGPLMITMPIDKGRLTFTLVEPFYKQPHDAYWLLTVTISWISRGCPAEARSAPAAIKP